METIQLSANGFEFSALAHGPTDGPLVLLLHGFPQSSHEWTRQLAALAEAGYRAVAPNQRGYSVGARPTGVEQYRMDHLVADTMAFAEQLGQPTFHLVGHDWGGLLAWDVAARYPQRVRSLTSVSTPHPRAFADAYRSPTSGQQEMSNYITVFRSGPAGEQSLLRSDGNGLERLFVRAGLDPQDAAEYQAHHRAQGALTAAMNWYRAQAPVDLTSVEVVEVPTLYIWGTDDEYVSREAAEGCRRYVVGPFEYQPFDGVGHWVPELASHRLNLLLIQHLSRSVSTRPANLEQP